MTIEATVIEDSISDASARITTFQLRYPRFVHAEFMTHRKFSRNASSSRAIPVRKMITDIRRDPAMPVYWGANQPGMQAAGELEGLPKQACQEIWLGAMEASILRVEALMEYGLHKQIANRILEPWAHINVVCTATEFRNFYALRRHPDAQPEIKALADAMFHAQSQSVPEYRRIDQWHLPYVTPGERDHFDVGLLKKVSVARCARVSYLTHEGKQTSIEEDTQLYERLIHRHPIHASPAEHQATPMFNLNNGSTNYREPVYRGVERGGNFVGWIQLRKLIDGEFIPG